MEVKNLKLIARTEEDLKVVSAHLQDSIANVSEIANLEKNKIFLMQLNRFMWEDVEKGVFRKNKRIRSILKFENIIKVHSKNINQQKKDKFLDFLTIETNQMPDNNYEMKIVFAGDSIIKVVSAHLQDSIANTSDIANLRKNKIFLLQLNRFMWEDVEKGVFRKNKRIRTVLKFENVLKVHAKNINQSKKDKFLDFLTIETNKMPDNNYEMKIVFAGDSIIKVISEVIEVTLDDQGEAWDTKNMPKHGTI